VGAAFAELVLATFPIAPAPFVPEVSTPAKLIMVIDAAGDDCEKVAVAMAFDNTVGANARQISAVPPCTLVRSARFHVNPPPVMPVTVMFGCTASLVTNASTSSFPTSVEKDPLVMVVELEP
jgi:hypothetical protein